MSPQRIRVRYVRRGSPNADGPALSSVVPRSLPCKIREAQSAAVPSYEYFTYGVQELRFHVLDHLVQT